MEEKILNNEENEGITLGEIFSWIWKKKLIGLITAIAIFLVVFIGVRFIYNPMVQTYTVNFQYANIPGLANGHYLDGSSFDYQGIISEESINSVIEASPEKFKNIDVTKLLESESISIILENNYLDPENNNYTILSTNYKMTFPLKPFGNFNIAKSFVMDLIQIPVKKSLTIVDSLTYDSNLILSESSSSFGSQYTFLNSQVELLNNGYDNWISSNSSETLVMVDGTSYTLHQLKSIISNYLESENFYSISEEIRLNGYVKFPQQELEKYKLQLESLKDTEETLKLEKENLADQLNSLYTQLNTSSSQSQIIITEAITLLVSKISDVDGQILTNQRSQKDVNKKIETIKTETTVASQEFASRLSEIHTKLTEFTKTYSSVSKTLYNRDMAIFYSNSNVLTIEGGFGTLLTLLASALLGGGCGVFLAGILGYNAKKKEETPKKIK